ncbi:MAG: ABC transporter substrate-binding protein [Clostridiales bacterium]|jgi:N-acetylglucosamine transport system substrate-binding protein|nr:ABC transporter substrate-binding protein [Clostridiales bacterium]
MKKIAKFLSLLLCATLMPIVSGCGTVTPPPEQPSLPVPQEFTDRSGWVPFIPETFPAGSELKIRFFKGGYGREWLDAAKEKFEAEYEGVTIRLIESTTEADFTTLLPEMLNNNAADIFMCHNIPWEKMALQGKIMNLDALYGSTVYTDIKNLDDDGKPLNVTYLDRVAPSSLNGVRMNVNDAPGYFRVPQVQGSGGLAYNKTLFAQNGWQIPKTYQELIALCDTINSSGAKNASGDTIAPIVWGGSNDSAFLWDSIVFDWWVQMAGMDEFDRFMKFEDKTVFNPEVYPYLKQAWTYWYDFLVKNPGYSLSGSIGLNNLTTNMAFAAGQAAMTPATCWFANEVGFDVLEQFNCDVGIMPTPLVPEVRKNADQSPIRVSYDLAGKDSIIVGNRASNNSKMLAQEFLKWLALEENALLFPKHTNGLLLAMRYDFDNMLAAFEPGYITEDDLDPDLEGLTEDEQYFKRNEIRHKKLYAGIAQTTWAKDMFAILNTSTRFNLYSGSAMTWNAPTPLSPYPDGNYYAEAFERWGTAEADTRSPDSVFNGVWTRIDSQWDTMRAAAGL